MVRFNLAALAMTILLVATACGHQQTKFEGAKAFTVSNESSGKGVTVAPQWLKHKKNNIDTEVKITNNYAQAVVIKQHGITMTYNGEKTIARQSGRFSENMESGAFQMATLIFDFPKNNPAGGKATVTFSEIYKADGKSKLPPLKIDFDVLPLK